MATDVKKPEPPSTDARWKLVAAVMRRHGYRPNALIETLHCAQEAFGYLEPEALDYVAASLGVPPSKVYGVATFYHFFTLKPKGEHTCVVCTGTACYIKGAADILEAIEKEFNVQPGETTADNKLSLLTARCFGSCGLAPAATFDGEVVGKLTPEAALDRIRRWMDDDA
jgi:bidirectional [NiFe] hydrogenase diaphorase subunit